MKKKNKKIKNEIMELAIKNNLKILEKYLKSNNIEIQLLNNESSDILIELIDSYASFEVIKFIIKYGDYRDLDFTIGDSTTGKIQSPLIIALKRNNFRVADFLIEYGASIHNISYDSIHCLLNGKNMMYLLQKGYVTSELIYYLIANISMSNISLIKKLLKYFIYSNEFILKLLLIYQEKNAISNIVLHDILDKERNKIKINRKVYSSILENNNFDMIDIIYQYDIRDEEIIVQDLINLKNYNFDKYLMEKFETGNLMIHSNMLMNHLLNFKIELKKKKIFHANRRAIMTMIHNNDIYHFMKCIKENENHRLQLVAIHENFDNDIIILLLLCRRHKITSFNTKIFIEKYRQEINKYCKNLNGLTPSLLYYLISKNKFNFLYIFIRRGVLLDPNIINILYRNMHLNKKNFRYILDNFSELSINLQEFIRRDQFDDLKYIFRSIFNKRFILKLLVYYRRQIPLSNHQLKSIIDKERKKIPIKYSNYQYAIKNNNYKILELLYENDYRKKDIVLHELFNILDNGKYIYIYIVI